MNRTIVDVIAKLDAFAATGEECEDVARLDAILDDLSILESCNHTVANFV